MLLNKTELAGIKSGEVGLVFRRWRRPTVKSGGTLKTPIGVIAIERLVRIERSQISERDAASAGVASLSGLLERLDAGRGDLYRIEVRFAGADPRVQLRENGVLGDAELRAIRDQLGRLDAASKPGAWTLKVLLTIEQHPHVAASVLAQRTGFEKDRLKTNIRKLKNLGLTISHQPGYELSTRGKVVVAYLRSDEE